MSVTLADVLAGATAHAVPLTAECAGYLVLAAADQAVLAPRRMLAGDLELSEEGGIRVARARSCDEGDAERDLRGLLDELLLAASSVTPGLLRTGRRAPGGSVAALLREIETALIPVNRAAARRALARLQRETARALDSGKIPRERRPDSARSRVPSPVPPSVEVALAAIPSPPPPAAAAPAVTPDLRSEPLSVGTPSRPVPAVLTVPSDPVPPPTPVSNARVAPSPLIPSLTPPAVARIDAETRPEPVVLRASQRPPAAPATIPAPPPPQADTKPRTPVLGTVVAVRDVPPARGEGRDTIPAAPLVHALPEQVVIAPHEPTPLNDDLEIEYLDEPGALAGSDLTEQCPPVDEDPVPTPLVLTERLALPIVPAVPRARLVLAEAEGDDELGIGPASQAQTPVVTQVEPEPPVITEPEPSPIAELARVAFAQAAAELEAPEELDIELLSEIAPEVSVEPEIELAVLVEGKNELPEWTFASGDATLHTPPPRRALPKAQPSEVEDLLGRLDEAPLSVDELRTSLKHLAGMDPTPPPLGVRTND